MQSKEGRKKAFSTCSSHLCVVGLFFGIAMLVYMVPDSDQREEQEKILSLFHSLFNPMLNPLIYSLRNAQLGAPKLHPKQVDLKTGYQQDYSSSSPAILAGLPESHGDWDDAILEIMRS
ncbi:hypothetical protein A6R68_05498, partial [Neotoma lepida]